MSDYIGRIQDTDGNTMLPQTHERAVLDDEGTSLETKLAIIGMGGLSAPTLSNAPTSSTTSFIKDGETCYFMVGQFCRVANAQSETGYDFYQMQDLTITNEGEENETRTASWYKLKDDIETYKLNINGTEQGGGTTSLGTVYAPIEAGTEGQMLIANASGIPTWGSKPSYSLSEVGASSSVVAVTAATSSSCSITGSSNSGKMQTIVYTNNSGSSKVVTVPTTYATPDGAAIELTVPNGGYCEVNYLNIGGTIYARGL